MKENKKPLSNSQWEIFAQEVANGSTLIKASIKARYKNNSNLNKNAHKRMQNVVIQRRIAELKEEIAERYILSREELLIQLGRIIRDGVTSNRDIISAVSQAAKIQGLDSSKLVLDVRGSVENMSNEQLEELIKKGEVKE